MQTLVRIFGTGASTIGIAVLAARAFIALNPPPWEVTEYAAFALWSVPLAIVVVLLSGPLRRRLVAFSGFLRVAVACIAGLLAGGGCAFTGYFVTGGWILAYDFPVLYCWVAGAAVGLAIALLWPEATTKSSA